MSMDIWEMKRARTAAIEIFHINTEKESARCGRCLQRLKKGMPWEAPGRCMKCGIYLDRIEVYS